MNIGQVRFQFGGREEVAILRRDGRWVCRLPEIACYLQVRFPLKDVSPADGIPGSRQLCAAAADLGGAAEMPEMPEVPRDTSGITF
jgi:hypothetical protein